MILAIGPKESSGDNEDASFTERELYEYDSDSSKLSDSSSISSESSSSFSSSSSSVDDRSVVSSTLSRQHATGVSSKSRRRVFSDNLRDGKKARGYSKHHSPIKHDGCINTAAWLEEWKLVHSDGSFSSSSNQINPVESFECSTQVMTSGDDCVVKIWDVSGSMGSVCNDSEKIPCSYEICSLRYHDNVGGASLLATLATGHTMNIFHISSIPENYGKLATCGADSHLRMIDCEYSYISSQGHASNQTSTVIVSPPDEDTMGFPSMFFSHQFLNSNAGLICTESQGLFLFDIRLAPSQQVGTLSLEPAFMTCKACAILPSWKMPFSYEFCNESSHSTPTTYCLVGGSSSDVALFDIRFASTGGSTARAVQKYRPSYLKENDNVSVSGIDVKKDGKEFIVSYENDTIYSFPLRSVSQHETTDSIQHVQESGCYGGHLNRLTFLKVAKYAGPNDDYIVTGSDSGHAWIYDRYGGVSSFLKADSATCNGIVPHTRLPIFVTYGIDSTAKLWRAVAPSTDCKDESLKGRILSYQNNHYEKSTIVSDWSLVQKKLKSIKNRKHKIKEYYPDNVPDSKDKNISFQYLMGMQRTEGKISNNLNALPKILQQNLWSCSKANAHRNDNDVMESGAKAFSRRLSNIRLKHCAFLKGLRQDSNRCWIMKKPTHISSKIIDTNSPELLPDYPSDWFRFDPLFTRNSEFLNEPTGKSSHSLLESSIETCFKSSFNKKRALCEFLDAISSLKDKGNIAVKEHQWNFAASLYDKAIRYCAMVFMDYPCRDLIFVSNFDEEKNSWLPLRKVLVSCRLNLSLAMQSDDISDWKGSIEQAKLALSEMDYLPREMSQLPSTEDKITSDEVLKDVNEFRAKALFRLGCAQHGCGQFQDAILSFLESIKITRETTGGEVAKIVLRRLAESKRQLSKQKERRRKKFKTMFD